MINNSTHDGHEPLKLRATPLLPQLRNLQLGCFGPISVLRALTRSNRCQLKQVSIPSHSIDPTHAPEGGSYYSILHLHDLQFGSDRTLRDISNSSSQYGG